ncbi:hypothetical protein [Mycolicibacterium sp. S2-37]|uniref:hypothetical protein n=1 Tax=Mycolicibacterium sp. S2-37 TaxID=2810297 RepID=UPI0027DA18FB|nr:hypothetical protein [Mycolicibacterium sp. S2-37]
MVYEWVAEDRLIDIAPLDMGAASSQVEQMATILDDIVEYLFTSAGSEVEHPIRWAEDGVYLREKRNSDIRKTESAYIALGVESPAK